MTGALGLSHHYLKILTIRLSRTQIRIFFFTHNLQQRIREPRYEGILGKKVYKFFKKSNYSLKKKKKKKNLCQSNNLASQTSSSQKGISGQRFTINWRAKKNILERLLLQPTNIPPTKCKDAPKKNSIYSAANPTKIPSGELHVPEMGESPGNAVWGSQVPPGEIQCWNWKRI